MASGWNAVAALVDRSRRALYEFVRRQGRPVTREEAAAGVRISRNLAAFHLDKLVDVGLLRADYQARSGRRRRGRTPKVYEPAGDVSVTIPERRYRLIAEILADAVAAEPGDADRAARRRARDHGRTIGTGLRETGTGQLDTVLDELGFDPRTGAAGEVRLGNCPFHALALRHTDLVCGLNHAFLTGLLEGLAVDRLHPRLAPQPGTCCVELARRAPRGGDAG